MAILSMQFRAAFFILLVVLIRSLLLYKLPKKVFIGLWALACARLIFPYSYNLSLGFSLPSVETALLSLLHMGNEGSQAANGATASIQFTAFSIPGYVWLIWLIGCVGLALYFVLGHLRGSRVYRFAYPIQSEAVEMLAKENRLWRRVRILQCPNLSSALTCGIIRPVILLPATLDLKNTEQLRFVLTHEFMHVKHFDVLWKWVSAAALCVAWFNPLSWVMYLLLGRDLELNCDESVLKKCGMNRKNKADYAMALLSLAEEKRKLLPMASHFSKSAAEERILSIMHGRNAPGAVLVPAVLGITFLALLLFTTVLMDAGVALTLPLS